MLELADETDSKSVDGNIVRVRPPPPAPHGDPKLLRNERFGIFYFIRQYKKAAPRNFLKTKYTNVKKAQLVGYAPNTGHPVLGVYPYEKPNCAFFWF